jgi:hypothetical protein
MEIGDGELIVQNNRSLNCHDGERLVQDVDRNHTQGRGAALPAYSSPRSNKFRKGKIPFFLIAPM